MSFLKRLSYYLGGFSVGILLLVFFLSGKNTRCTYTPDARVINDFSKKEWFFNTPTNDSIDRTKFLKGGDIVFSKSREWQMKQSDIGISSFSRGGIGSN